MNIKNFDFPTLNGLDVAFSTVKTDPSLLKEAKERGFYRGNTKYNDLFGKLFYSGGKLDFKKDLPETFKTIAFTYLKAFMNSFEPKHEEKEAICALLLSELVNV